MITAHHHAQNLINLDLLNLVNQRGQCSAAELFNQFCLDPTNSSERKRMATKLNYLVYSAQLCRHGRGQTAQYWLGPQAGKPTASAARARALPTPVRSFNIPLTTPARTDNTMSAPAYVPGPGPALRPGALDYQRIASHGFRC